MTAERRRQRYLKAAKRLYEKEGTLEIDGDARLSTADGSGAYVQAWVWVSAEDAGVKPPKQE